MTAAVFSLPTRIIRRVLREAIWYIKYQWNPFNNIQIARAWAPDFLAVKSSLTTAGISFEEISVPVARFSEFLKRCGYPIAYHSGQGTIFTEKCLEHFLSCELLGIERNDVYIDLASDGSPFPHFVRDCIGAHVFINDLKYPPGITDGWRIGADATRLPLPNRFISRATLHCSLEHFEGDSDIRLMRELGRVLRPGGKVCIAPLYLDTHYFGMTDPDADRTGLEWDPEMQMVLSKGYGQRHGRFYDVAKLKERIYSNLGSLKPRLFNVVNLDEVAKGLWCHWILILQKEAH